MEIHLNPIGFVRGGRVAAEDDDWGSVQAEIVLDADRFAPDALNGLAEFSHAEIIYHFHQVPDSDIVAGARHPRGRADWPAVGIFAQRGRTRPNRLGVSTCEIVSVSGLVLAVRGLDAIDGTPVLDIKPVLSGFAPRGTLREPAWARAIMETYW
jgi:tRNA-Thr(GGU) m(6)t(6)A37 methyltransferase TsaA